MASKPKIEIEITADSTDARRDIDKTGGMFDKFKDNAKSAGVGMLGAVGGVVALGVSFADSAADAERASTTVQRVFGDAAGAVEDFARDAAQNVGVSTQAYDDMAGKIGTSLKGMGLDTQTAATKTNDLLVAAGDMALALGIDVPTAAEAMSAGLRGEFDALSEFGVNVSDASVQAGLAAKGISGPEGMDTAAYNAAYQQELLNQVLAGVGSVYGGYRAETDTTTERTDLMKASFENAKTELGNELLPMLQTGAEKLQDFIGWVTTNKEAIKLWVPIIAGAALAVWALNWALAANPIVLWTTLLLLAGAAIYIFREDIYNWGISALTAMNDALSSGDWWNTQFQEVLGALGLSAEDFSTTIDNISTALSNLWDWFSRQWSFSLPSVPLAPGGLNSAPAGFTVSTLSTVPAVGARSLAAGALGAPTLAGNVGVTAAGAPVVINVNGALDPDAVARQIERLLRGRSRRQGSVLSL